GTWFYAPRSLRFEPGRLHHIQKRDATMHQIQTRESECKHERAAPNTRNVLCAHCGKPIKHLTGRRPRFCCDRCRKREHGKQRIRKAFLRRDTGAATKRTKNLNNLSALQAAKKRSRVEIVAPADVLTTEVFDRAWQAVTSSGGIPIEIGRLRPRALV